MRIAFWLSGVMLGTLLSTVCMADFVDSHPHSVLGRWFHTPAAADPAAEAAFAPPAVIGEAPLTPAAEAVVDPQQGDNGDGEQEELLSFGEPLPLPYIPPPCETESLFAVPFVLDQVAAVADVEETYQAELVVDEGLAVVEILPVMPAVVETIAFSIEFAEPLDEFIANEEDAGDCPLARQWADTVYAWMQDCIQGWIAVFSSDDVEIEVNDAAEAEHGEFGVSIGIDFTTGRCVFDVQFKTKPEARPAEKPATEEPKKHQEFENAEALEFDFLPECLLLPFGPEFPAEQVTEQTEDDINCPPGHEAVCPVCGNWWGCDQPASATDADSAELSEVEDSDMEIEGGCLDMNDCDEDVTESEPIFDLLYRLDGPNLL